MSTITKSLEKAPYWKVVIAYWYVLALRASAGVLKARHPRKRLCVCLQYIGDNGPCPVHGKGA